MKTCWGCVLHLLCLLKVRGHPCGLYISSQCRIWLVEKEIGPGMSYFQRKPQWFCRYLCTQMRDCTYLRSRVFWQRSFHGTIPTCRHKSAGEFQSLSRTKHRGLLRSEDHKAKLHLFLTEPSAILITSLARWQCWGGAVISYGNTKGKENINFKLCGLKALNKTLQYTAIPAFIFLFSLGRGFLSHGHLQPLSFPWTPSVWYSAVNILWILFSVMST